MSSGPPAAGRRFFLLRLCCSVGQTRGLRRVPGDPLIGLFGILGSVSAKPVGLPPEICMSLKTQE